MITWKQIEAELLEATDYRDAHVRHFRKYEGQETEERTAQGRVVKVTQRSYARHFKIPPMTFRHWLDASACTKRVLTESDRTRLDQVTARAKTRPAIRPLPADSANAQHIDVYEQPESELDHQDRFDRFILAALSNIEYARRERQVISNPTRSLLDRLLDAVSELASTFDSELIQ